MKTLSRILGFALILSVLPLTALSCATPAVNNPYETASQSGGDSTAAETETTPETDVLDPYAGINLGGREIRIHTSINVVDNGNGMSSSNKYIEGAETLNGDIVSDDVYERNMLIQEKLGCKLKFTQINQNYDKVLSSISVPVSSGEDFTDLIINDQYGLVRAAYNGYLFNLLDEASYNSTFNFEDDGWYYDYMKELTVSSTKMYLMAGDFFIDVLRNAHALYFNTNIYTNIFGSPDGLYSLVESGGWTYEVLLEKIKNAYFDSNGSGTVDTADTFGIIMPGAEGSLYPFIFSSNIRSVTFSSDNVPTFITDIDEVSKLCDTIMGVYSSQGADFTQKTSTIMQKFTSGEALFLNYFRIGDLEDGALRSMSGVGLVPYPKLYENQSQYYTTVHDTAEMGAIPKTCRIAGDVSILVQAMMRYTNEKVLPDYYETSLKLKYAQDEPSSRMIDIIRGGITSPFELAYGYQFGRPLYVSIRDSIKNGANIVSSTFKSLQKSSVISLEKFIAEFNKDS